MTISGVSTRSSRPARRPGCATTSAAWRPSTARAVVDQAHAGDSGFGLLKLGNIDLDQLEAAIAEGAGGARIACGQDQPVAGAETIGRRFLCLVGGDRIDTGELARIHRSLIVKNYRNAVRVGPGEGRSGLEVQAIPKLGLYDRIAQRGDELPKRSDPVGIGPRGLPDVQLSPDAQNVAAIEAPGRDVPHLEPAREAGGGRPGLIGARGGAGAGDDRVAVEQQGGVLDE